MSKTENPLKTPVDADRYQVIVRRHQPVVAQNPTELLRKLTHTLNSGGSEEQIKYELAELLERLTLLADEHGFTMSSLMRVSLTELGEKDL